MTRVLFLLLLALAWCAGCGERQTAATQATPTPPNPADLVDPRPPMLAPTPEPVATLEPLVGRPKPGPTRQVQVPARVRQGPVIQIALILDTSKSMDGLLHQAQSRLWNVVTEMSAAKHKGQRPELELALLEYGCNRRLPSASGYIRRVVPLTMDLDAVSEELFKLTCEGGLENAPWAVETAVSELDWSQDPDDLKAIFIAGNESFEQGPVTTRHALDQARSRGILVNTIFCGSNADARLHGWDTVAAQGGGAFVAIDQERTVVALVAPQDQEIARLNEELNQTYIPYGEAGEEGRARQLKQDQAVAAMAPSAAAVRTGAKAQHSYRNDEWDLVDAAQTGKVKAAELPPAAYPKALRDKSPEQRAAYVEGQARRRSEVQKEINRLLEERKQYAKPESAGGESLDTAVAKTLKKQAKDKGYSF